MNKVEICGVNTSTLPVLSHEEKLELLKRMKEGDKEARRIFIEGNLRLVLSVVQKFANRGENLDDLFQVGCIGLIKAIDNFDLSQNVKFSTYAVPMIIGEIRRYLRDNNSMRISRSLKDTAYKALKIKEKYISNNQKEPTLEEIAKELSITKEELVFTLDSIQEPISLYEPVFQDSTDTMYVVEKLYDHKSSENVWLEEISLKDALSRLTKREKEILYLHYYKGKTQMEVARIVGISQAQVSRIEKSAIGHIKKYI
ncbi:RNA polymerase sporulation sigma factor SigG [Caldicellulosiruptor acetigenus]|uniref:RNA polymerase sigma factor n=1 Tax=Caldicellulosiruptor acetigenus 6A TaxID=632516 RepID=G2PXV0_9FIRM|nr:RNA polymerase sporulation sigma factor SigG [Caldicellulosiruptor acetigenus]AEM73946.1 RNA polymerase, sigma 28 subunit, Sig B/F/G subfamily [Caldicellulosiruptor acetigenus 6A]